MQGLPQRVSRYSASATVQMCDGGVLLVKFSGPVTAQAMDLVKRQIVRDCPADSVRAIVADYSAAVIAMSGDQLDQVLAGEDVRSVPAMPAAMVVRAECNSLFKGHSLRMAFMHGITRRVFNDMQPAMEWAAEAAKRSASWG